MTSPTQRGTGAASRNLARWWRCGRRVLQAATRPERARRTRRLAARPPPPPWSTMAKEARADVGKGGAVGGVGQAPAAAWGRAAASGAAFATVRNRPQARAAPRRPTAAARRKRCAVVAGRCLVTAWRRRRWPVARRRTAPVARRRRGAPPQQGPPPDAAGGRHPTSPPAPRRPAAATSACRGCLPGRTKTASSPPPAAHAGSGCRPRRHPRRRRAAAAMLPTACRRFDCTQVNGRAGGRAQRAPMGGSTGVGRLPTRPRTRRGATVSPSGVPTCSLRRCGRDHMDTPAVCAWHRGRLMAAAARRMTAVAAAARNRGGVGHACGQPAGCGAAKGGGTRRRRPCL